VEGAESAEEVEEEQVEEGQVEEGHVEEGHAEEGHMGGKGCIVVEAGSVEEKESDAEK
jgi:hypothetical protein